MGLLEILLLVGFILGLTIFLLLYIFGEFNWLVSSIITTVFGIIILVISSFFTTGFEGIPIQSIGGAITLLALVFLSIPYLWKFVKSKIQKGNVKKQSG